MVKANDSVLTQYGVIMDRSQPATSPTTEIRNQELRWWNVSAVEFNLVVNLVGKRDCNDALATIVVPLPNGDQVHVSDWQ